MSDNLQDALAKIRPHTSSSLAHQKAPATLLIALESTFEEQKTQRTPTAYFAALLTTLDSTLQTSRTSEPALGDGDVLPAELYLLALVTPFVPHPVIRSNLSTILSLTAPLFPALVPHAPPLRSQLTFYDAVLRALDRSHLETPGLRQTFESILHLCLDPRPKVRKRAAELVRDVLTNPPPPSLRHPYSDRVADWVKAALAEVTAGGAPKFKGKKAESEGTETAIHLLTFLRPVLATFPPSSLPSITSSLLNLPRLGNPYLSQSAYSLLADLLLIPVEDPVNNIEERLPDIISAIVSSPPLKSDGALIPSWSNVLGIGMMAYHKVDSENAAKKIPEVWNALWAFLESSEPSVRKAIAQALDNVSKCITEGMIAAAVKENPKGEKKSTKLGKIINQTVKALDSLAFARSIPELLSVVASLITSLRYRPDGRGTPTAAETLLLPLMVKICDMRLQKGFEYKESADAVISTAMGVLGPAVLLEALPLNLMPEDRQAGKEPRAFLLPMLSQPHPSPLTHFTSYFLPYTSRLFDLAQTALSANRASEAKVYNVLIDQIWSGFFGYCYPTDSEGDNLSKALNPEFAGVVSQVLYTQPELRPGILKGLRIIVESNLVLSRQDQDQEKYEKLPDVVRLDGVSKEEAEANVRYLKGQVESWLAVLFNVFTSVGRDGQGMVGDVVSAWLTIADEKEINKAYKKLTALLSQNLSQATSSQPNQPKDAQPQQTSITATALDLLTLILPHLSRADALSLFNVCLTSEVLEHRDNAVQKRGYKVLAKLLESGKVSSEGEGGVDVTEVLKKLDNVVDGLSPAAKKDRFHVLTHLLSHIPSTSLHLIPAIIPEAVLGTKEPSEKARNAAFDLIVAMGRRMAQGGVVKRGLVDGMDEDGEGEATGEAKASIEEYMTMVAGGLAGATPHMISATVTAISRLVFEFKDQIPPEMHTEILSTLLVFLTSNNREIVKSTLGYIKLSIHTMPLALLQPHLPSLVPALLKWSHDHKNHFKAKVRHIFERMIRRFGFDEVYKCASSQEDGDGVEEARKVLVNIKKRKERAKRKKGRAAANEDGEDEDDGEATKPATGDAFEDVLYGSESELEDSDDDEPESKGAKKKGNGGARLRVDDDEPMDLLSGAASKITNAKNKRRKPGADASKFATDADGKMIIDDEDSHANNHGEDEEDVAGQAYRETLTSADGFTRGPNGRIKFNKDTKKRRRENDEMAGDGDGDVEMGDATTGGGEGGGRKAKRKSEVRLGQEFKAKKAGGDVKKGGVDPYAYLPLSQAAKKKGKKERIHIVGKR